MREDIDSNELFKGLGSKDKEYVAKYKTLFYKILNDLYKQDMLRLKFTTDDRKAERIIITMRNLSDAFNLYDAAYTGKKGEEYIKANEKFGLHDETLASIWVIQEIMTIITQVELFKTLLLIYLQKKNGINAKMTLGDLLRKLRELSPKCGAELSSYINNKLRNALVHGYYWIKDYKLHYAEDSSLQNVTVMELHEFMKEVRKHNLLCQTFLYFGSIRMKLYKDTEGGMST